MGPNCSQPLFKMLDHVHLQSLYWAGPISSTFYMKNGNTHRGGGSWDLCECICPNSRESQGLTLSKSGSPQGSSPARVEGSQK